MVQKDGVAASIVDRNVSSGSSVIRAIPSHDVHRITSGQVVLDLQTAVKELVENALDASATNIAVNFRDYGADSFEVVDNGTGIDASNYANVALKHYTSKLSSFSDLSLVRTFGFRGEALSSLCALAKVTIHTATSDQAPMGTILQLGKSGKVESDTGRAARQRGTTIIVEGLFKVLPVRRKEFEKNLKREYTKTQNLLQAYALITKGVRWTSTNTPAGGRKTPQFSVNSSTSDNYLSANVSALFGAKVVPTLMPLNLELTFSVARSPNKLIQHTVEAHGDNDDEEILPGDESSTVNVMGLISKPIHGSGRTSSDRQFFYINGRPWDAGRVGRAFNEVYKSYNSNHFPFVAADFRLPTDSYDVNITPDKRTIFLHEENRLIEKVKQALEELFAPSRATFFVNGASHSLRNGSGVTRLSAQSRLGGFTAKTDDEPMADDLALHPEIDPAAESDEDPEDAQTHQDVGQYAQQADSDSEEAEHHAKVRSLSGASHAIDLEYREDSNSPSPLNGQGRVEQADDDRSEADIPALSAPEPDSPCHDSSKREYDGVLDTNQASCAPTKRQRVAQSLAKEPESPASEQSHNNAHSVLASLRTFALPGTQIADHLPVSNWMAVGNQDEQSTPMAMAGEKADMSSEEDLEFDHPVAQVAAIDDDQVECADEPLSNKFASMRKDAAVSDLIEHEQIISFDLDRLQQRLLQRRTPSWSTPSGLPASEREELLQGAGVENQDEAQVERALSRVIHKDDFAAMEVIGQFNLGFIIARRRTRPDSSSHDMDDLFIVDQHASDEKFNFETLQLTTQIRSQKLIVPRPLELSASDELVAIEHQETLLSNGFDISVSETGLPGTRAKLVAQPISKATVFGVKDLEELLYLLRDTSAGSEAARSIRCSKARAMFASRACRKSIMIGTALTRGRMKSVLNNMGTIEQPWNCPHGRPTMRHLVCLKTVDAEGQARKAQSDENPSWEELVECLA